MKLNLGCGLRKRKDCINIDNRPEMDPDLVCDGLNLPYEDNSVDVVYATDYLEHIPIGKTHDQINEIWRVLKDGGLFIHETPSTEGLGAFQDPFHLSFWNINSWLYYMNDQYRRLYNTKAKFTGTNEDVWYGKVCHTKGILTAVKTGKE